MRRTAMPNRIIRENILTSDRVDALSYEAEVFYRRLMSVVDDYGRFDGRLSIIRARLYPLRLDKVKDILISKWMDECVKAGVIVAYQVNKSPYIELLRFGQKIRAESKWPSPADKCAQMIAVADESAVFVSVCEGVSEGVVVASASPKDSGLAKAATAWLETIYLAYPRRVGKHAAVKAIAAAVKRIKDKDDAVGFLLDRVTAYAAAVKGQDPQFIPHPATWFNSGRYEDDETQWQRSGNHRPGAEQIGRIDAAPDKYAGLGITVNVDAPAQYVVGREQDPDAW